LTCKFVEFKPQEEDSAVAYGDILIIKTKLILRSEVAAASEKIFIPKQDKIYNTL
jgi:hypothetical protein